MEGPHVMTLWTREYKPSLTTPESDAHLWRVGRNRCRSNCVPHSEMGEVT